MFKISIANIIVLIRNNYEFVEKLCTDYITENSDFDFEVSVAKEEIDKERLNYTSKFSDGFIESVCIYRHIANELPKYNAFVLHSASVEVNNSAFCFAAKSGTGKTTHALLWQSSKSINASIINGDKPIIKFIDSKPYVCGTPWSGKEDLNRNIIVSLKAIALISQAKENSILPIDNHKAFSGLIQQAFIPDSQKHIEITIDLLGKLASEIPMWQLNCNISEESANLAFITMNKEI